MLHADQLMSCVVLLKPRTVKVQNSVVLNMNIFTKESNEISISSGEEGVVAMKPIIMSPSSDGVFLIY